MILLRILEHDLHRSRSGVNIPYQIDVPAVIDFIPAIISSTRGKFLVSRKLTNGDDVIYKPKDELPMLIRGGKIVKKNIDVSSKTLYIGVGVFSQESENADVLIGDIINAAFQLSIDDSLGNIFVGKDRASKGFSYVQKSSGMVIQPHVCLTPTDWTPDKKKRFFGADLDGAGKYKKICRIVPCSVPFPVFLSRPDMVGLYTQFLGGGASILIHNVALGMAFCPLKIPSRV
jgi:hypothetical protein